MNLEPYFPTPRCPHGRVIREVGCKDCESQPEVEQETIDERSIRLFQERSKEKDVSQQGEKKITQSLDNETVIRFGNAFNEMVIHAGECVDCQTYLGIGVGKLCDKGNQILLNHLYCANTETIRWISK